MLSSISSLDDMHKLSLETEVEVAAEVSPYWES
jgi:hypothetical protein